MAELMTSHQLARLLLSFPDLPVATHSHNRTAIPHPSYSEELKVGVLTHHYGEYVVIGNFTKLNLNKPNWYVTKMLTAHALPEEWS